MLETTCASPSVELQVLSLAHWKDEPQAKLAWDAQGVSLASDMDEIVRHFKQVASCAVPSAPSTSSLFQGFRGNGLGSSGGRPQLNLANVVIHCQLAHIASGFEIVNKLENIRSADGQNHF